MARTICMASLLLVALCGLALAAEEKPAATAAAAPAAPAPAEDKDGFRPLFNGKDLTGWRANDESRKHWTAGPDGILQYDGKNRELKSEKSFADFILKVDWRMKEKSDSGIYLRGSSKAQVNIWTDPMGSGEVYGYRKDAAMPEEVRKGATPKKKADKPLGEWNSFLITMKGDRLTVVLNGEEVISNAKLPDVPQAGPLTLQHHGYPIEFRNIYIKELSAAPAEAPKKEGGK